VTEDGVLISTDSQVASVGATLGLNDWLHVSAEASRCRSKDKFRNAASVTNTQNDVLADTSIIEDVLAAGVEWQLARNLTVDGRYQYANLDDQTDDTQDGWVKTAMATLSLKW
jgi:opacity protein-like surface antigen